MEGSIDGSLEIEGSIEGTTEGLVDGSDEIVGSHVGDADGSNVGLLGDDDGTIDGSHVGGKIDGFISAVVHAQHKSIPMVWNTVEHWLAMDP